MTTFMHNHNLIVSALLLGGILGMGGQTAAQTVTGYDQLTNIPTLYVETTSGADPADKENYLPCTVRLVDGGTTTTYEMTENGIRGRGNSTWGAQKKPWRLKLDKAKELLGSDFAKAKNWTLLANAYDKSLMRNALTYHLGTFMNLPFCPAAKFVDLVMNGTYRGVYQLSDQVDVRSKRVDISEEEGWLLEYANASDKVDDPKITLATSGKTYGYVQIKNPSFDNDAPSQWTTADQTKANTIGNYLNNSLMPRLIQTVRTELINPRTGYRALTNEETLIDWYVATEITANWDGFYSIYMFRDQGIDADTTLQFGPLWDEDLAYGNNWETYSTSYFPKGDFYNKLLVENNFNTTSMGGYRKMQPVMKNLWNDPWFAISVKRRFDELVAAGLKDYLYTQIEAMRTELSTAAAKNYERWSITTDCDYGQFHSNYSWNDYVDELKTFVGNRIDVLSSLFANRAAGIQWFAEDTDFSLDASTTEDVVIKRTFAADTWSTLCLPFALTTDDIAYYLGSGAKVAEFTSVSSANGTTPQLNFSSVTTTVAGKPYLVKPALDVNVAFTFLDKSLSVAAPQAITYGNYTFTGTYNPYTATASDATKLYVDTDCQLFQPSETTTMKGYSAYFALSTTLAEKPELVVDSKPTAISSPSVETSSSGDIYNLSGQRMNMSADKLPKGIYIKNGKKFIVR